MAQIEFVTAFDYTIEYRKGSTNGNADFISRLLEPAERPHWVDKHQPR